MPPSKSPGFQVRGYRHLEDLYRVGHPRAGANVLHMEAQVMLILSGRFIGFLPQHIGEEWVERGAMRALKPQRYSFQSEHFVAHRREDAKLPMIKSFVNLLRQVSSENA